ncbi:uncharacterized protein LOC126284805 [Schistocerca gregaria]|uniref:uncharacterized protein LOC126284805 n=1 Tax=Schistocerca gregaria TaxID=7010 RepID=UPI00211E93FA|nr:uncharacterized protein LOC126284805 [Schistocerca gregaria]
MHALSLLFVPLLVSALCAPSWGRFVAADGSLPTTTTEGPPQPYSFVYVAGRYPGHIDRTHNEESDGSGVVRGSFAYIDPRYQVRTVEYTADKQGFHPIVSLPVADTPTVAAAKQKHAEQYARIAAEHQRIAAEREALLPQQPQHDGDYNAIAGAHQNY